MSKRERLREVKSMNPQWLGLRFLFALPTGVLIFYQNYARIRPLLNVKGEALVKVGDESPTSLLVINT